MGMGTDIKQRVHNIGKHDADSPSTYLTVKMIQSSVCLYRLPLKLLSKKKKKNSTISLQSDVAKDRVCTSSIGCGCSYNIEEMSTCC